MFLGVLAKNVFQVEDSASQIPVTSVTDQWEKVVPGTLYVAIRGRRFDGHDYLKTAQNNGACGAVVQQVDPSAALPQFPVADTRTVYALLCARMEGSPAERLTLIGITGTNGKTTTAYLLRHMLSACKIRCGMIGTVETDDGKECVPSSATTPDPAVLHRTLSRMTENGCTHGIMEVSSQALDQSRTEGIRFRVGCFTNLSVDHLDYHGTMEAYRKAKLRLFEQSDFRLVNADSDYAAPFLTFDGAIRYSVAGDGAFTARQVYTGRDGISYVETSPSGRRSVRLPMWGEFNVYNSLAALACAEIAGANADVCAASLTSFPGVRGRLERVPCSAPFRIVIDYAHTPDGLEKVLRSLRAVTERRLTVVFGCGGERDRSKRPQMGRIASTLADFVWITSDNPRGEAPDAIIADILSGVQTSDCRVVPDRTEAICKALKSAGAGDCVLLAGKGHETYQVFSDRTIRYDEREIVREILKKEGLE